MLRHVLCVYPYRVEASPRNHVYPPLGLEIIAAKLAPESRSIDVIDLRRESNRAADFVRPDTDLVCFSVNWEIERESIREEILSVPRGVRVMVGGQYPSRDPEWWLSKCPNIDIIVRGDGAVVLIHRTHHEAYVLEVMAPVYLRDRLSLKDGSRVRVMVSTGTPPLSEGE